MKPGARGRAGRKERELQERISGALDDSSEWMLKGATLSDGTACKEFGLTRAEIIEGIRRGRLQYRMQAMHGNPFLRLLRREVVALVEKKHGAGYRKEREAAAELRRVDRELRALRRRVAALEMERARLLGGAGLP